MRAAERPHVLLLMLPPSQSPCLMFGLPGQAADGLLHACRHISDS